MAGDRAGGHGQYLAPTGQFLLAIATGEPAGRDTLLSFGLIWAGLAIFSVDAWRSRPRV